MSTRTSSSRLSGRVRVLARVSILLGLACVVAGFNAWMNPHRPAWAEAALAEGEITVNAARSLEPNGVLWIDARDRAAYTDGHVSGAVLLNETEWEALLPDVLVAWQPDQQVIVYCSSQACQASHAVAERLRVEVGLPEVWVLKGGWEAWTAGEN